jgi:hypothetical protein
MFVSAAIYTMLNTPWRTVLVQIVSKCEKLRTKFPVTGGCHVGIFKVMGIRSNSLGNGNSINVCFGHVYN